MPLQNITGKVFLVTGASTGIGNATAYRLSQAGATVIGTSRYPWLYPEPRPFPLFQLDQTSDDSVKQLADRITQQYGRLDGLHLNAGTCHASCLVAMRLVIATEKRHACIASVAQCACP
jgi:NAD(P)-dependent dehydrogenase (short-subunit alcohol dehydrogenase family)